MKDWERIRKIMQVSVLFELELVSWKEAQTKCKRVQTKWMHICSQLQKLAGSKIRMFLLAVLILFVSLYNMYSRSARGLARGRRPRTR